MISFYCFFKMKLNWFVHDQNIFASSLEVIFANLWEIFGSFRLAFGQILGSFRESSESGRYDRPKITKNVVLNKKKIYGRLEIRNFFCSACWNLFHSFATLTCEIFFITPREILYLRAPCNILYSLFWSTWICKRTRTNTEWLRSSLPRARAILM